MMSRHDWAMLGVVALSAFASGSLTCLAHQRIAEGRHTPTQGPTVVEVEIQREVDGNLSFAPLKPSWKGSLVAEPGVRLAFPPMRLKEGEGALKSLRWREETLSLFKGSVPFKPRSGESWIYMYVPLGETVPLEAGLRLRHPG